MLINERQSVQSAIINYHNDDYIQVSLYAPNAFQSNKSRKQITIQKSNTRPACKVFSTSEVLRGLGGRRGTQLVIYKSLAKVSGSDDNVASILVFVVVVYICILIGVCVCICAILEEPVVPYPALDGALPHITIPPNHLPCWWHLPWHWWRVCFENDNEKKLTS